MSPHPGEKDKSGATCPVEVTDNISVSERCVTISW